MSDVIRSFRIHTTPYRRDRAYEKDEYGDERKTPFIFPKYQPPTKAPAPKVEGVPPIARPKEETTNT
jgi:hypothetical protein